jgi:hypothetical protein
MINACFPTKFIAENKQNDTSELLKRRNNLKQVNNTFRI